MKVLERWRGFATDRNYRKLFDSDTLQLSEALFGTPPPLFNTLDPPE